MTNTSEVPFVSQERRLSIVQRIIDAIEAEPKTFSVGGISISFNQGGWAAFRSISHEPECGTALCVAGLASAFTFPKRYTRAVDETPEDETSIDFMRFGDTTVDYEDLGEHILGLDKQEADALFDGDNDKTFVLKVLRHYHKNEDWAEALGLS